MKILLVGEYNRAHKFLKEGLEKLGHDAKVVGLRDGFKKVDVDIEIHHRFASGIRQKFKNLILRLFKVDLHSVNVKKQIRAIKNDIAGHDVVQFINEAPFLCQANTEKYIFDFIKGNNSKSFLLSCGTDYPSVKYALDKKFRYSILTPYFEGRLKAKDFEHALKHLDKDFIDLHNHIYSHVDGVISSDLDYYIPLLGFKQHLGMVPHPINTEILAYEEPVVDNKIIIFHGINRDNYFKKGNDIFEKALDIISKQHSSKVEIITVENVPYSTYIKSFDRAHILLDQVYAYDQGYNALEAMAKGKVVFTGAETEWLEYYGLEEDTVAINATPDARQIALKLERLILNPQLITSISRNARAFVEREHNYIKSAEKSIDFWTTD